MTKNTPLAPWLDPRLSAEIKEDVEERAFDKMLFNEAGEYRMRFNQTFVYTDAQFDNWELMNYRKHMFDEYNEYNLENEINEEMFLPEESEDIQEKFDDQLNKEKEIRNLKEYIKEMSGRTIDGDRQLHSKRKSRKRRKWRIENLRKAA